MKKLLITVVMSVCVMAVSAIPARRGIWRTVTLGDGTQLQVELRGNEYMHFWQASDGRCFIKNESGEYVLTQRESLLSRAETNKARARGNTGQQRSHYSSTEDGLGEYGKSGMGSVGSIGEVTIPVILVDFADKTFKEENDIEKMDRYFNEEGYSDESQCVGSARDYFLAQSFGIFNPHFPVVAKVTLSKGYAEYGGNDKDGNDKGVLAMVREAVGLAVDQGVDFSQYYVGKSVPLVSLIYAGLGESSGGDENTIWPHQLDLSSWTSTISGYSFKSYFVGNELSYYGGLDGIGTFCHEFGHGLGLPDFYCTNYSYEDESPFGNWSVMDTGCMINNGRSPVGYTAYERSYLGWLTIPEITSPQGVVLGDPDVEGSVPAVLYRKPGNDKEYFIFENRQRTEWAAAEMGSGLLVTRFAYSKDKWGNNTLNNVKASKRACVMAADNAALFYSASQSNLYGNAVVNKETWKYFNNTDCNTVPIYKVMKHADRTISFNIMGNDAEYTYKPVEGQEYELVSNVDLLQEGDTVVLVNVADAVAMGKTQTTEQRIGVTVNVLNETTILAEETIQEVVLKKTANGMWALMVGDLYLTSSASGEKLIATAKPGSMAAATISIEDGNAVIAFQTKNSNKNIRYNVENTAFTCYKDQGDNIRIYAKRKDTNGIQPVISEKRKANTGVYTVTGQFVGDHPQGKGIYIVDGKKVVVK